MRRWKQEEGSLHLVIVSRFVFYTKEAKSKRQKFLFFMAPLYVPPEIWRQKDTTRLLEDSNRGRWEKDFLSSKRGGIQYLEQKRPSRKPPATASGASRWYANAPDLLS